MLKAVRRKVLYLVVTGLMALLLLGMPSAPAYADCQPVHSPTCTG